MKMFKKLRKSAFFSSSFFLPMDPDPIRIRIHNPGLNTTTVLLPDKHVTGADEHIDPSPLLGGLKCLLGNFNSVRFRKEIPGNMGDSKWLTVNTSRLEASN
jgi:hypothetical protein